MGNYDEAEDITPSDTTVEAGTTQHSETFTANDGVATAYYKSSGSGSIEVTLQASFDGGNNWINVEDSSESAIQSTEAEDYLSSLPRDQFPLYRLEFTETGGSSSVSIDEARGQA